MRAATGGVDVTRPDGPSKGPQASWPSMVADMGGSKGGEAAPHQGRLAGSRLGGLAWGSGSAFCLDGLSKGRKARHAQARCAITSP